MKQFLIIQLARFGDVVQTKRLIKSLELRGQVHLCIDQSLEKLAKIVYPKVILHTLPAHVLPSPSGFEQVHNSLQSIAEHNFDAVYNLNHAGLNRALARFFEAEQVIGYKMHAAQAVHSPWIRKAFTWTQNRVISPINLVDFWAFFDRSPCNPADVNPKAKAGGKGIGVALSGREARRSLPPMVLAPILRTLFERMGGPAIYLLGSASESTVARQLKRQMPANMLDKVQDLSGKTCFAGLVDAVQDLDVLLTPDTGIMHLAAHLGVPVQAFFLSSAWCHETGPYGEGHGVWQSVYECAPCLESAPCPINTRCLEDFKSRELLRALNAKALDTAQDKNNAPTVTSAFAKHLVHYTSCLDELGSTWQLCLGEDIYAKRRLSLRATLAEQCGFALPHVPIPNEMAEIFYDESDWMIDHTHAFIEEA